MDTMVRRCALPGCAATIEQEENRPARLYCSVEHRRQARRRRAEHAHRSDPVGRRERPAPPGSAHDGPAPNGVAQNGAAQNGAAQNGSGRDVAGPEPAGSVAVRRSTPDVRCGRLSSGPARTGPVLASALTHDTLVRPVRSWSARWRTALRGPVSAGGRARDERRADLVARAGAPWGPGPHRVAVVSLKGGVGKTTVAAGVGLTLSEQRGDRIVGVDAAPNQGTLADRLTGPLPVGMHDLLAAHDQVGSVSDLFRYTGLVGRLSVVAGEHDPGAARGICGDEHRRVNALLGRYFDLMITDCGPGMMHSAARNAVAEADALIVVGEVASDGATRASATLDWLAAHGYPEKAASAVVALCRDRAGGIVPVGPAREELEGKARSVVVVPHDPALVAGAPIRVDDLRDGTRDSFLELGALVVDGLGR